MGPILPQNRKYLCQAPRPEIWADISKHVLSEIGRNEIVATIEHIQSFHSIEPRVGPGRKSNAEHALQFYRYLLQEIDDDEETDDDEVAPPEQPTTPAQEPKPRHTKCEICTKGGDTSPLIPCSTCHLVFHAECLRPKLEAIPEDPWRCAYCIMADSTIKRSSRARKQATASVRQLARLKNQYERERAAAESGRTAESTGNGTKEELPGHAIREESTGNIGKEEDEKDNSGLPKEDTNEERPTESITAVETAGTADETMQLDVKHEDTETKEIIEGKVSDGLEPSGGHEMNTMGQGIPGMEAPTNASASDSNKGVPADPTSDTTVEPPTAEEIEAKEAAAKRDMELGPSSPERSRRNRKQPTLYDPQLGPASQWFSDENAALRAGRMDISDDEEGEDEEEEDTSRGKKGPTKESIRQQAREGGEETFWCNFCKDSLDVPVCVFCACRLCFGKHDKDSMLSCVDCQEEYHSACLSATGVEVEKDEAPWRCPACVNARKAPKRTTPSRLKSKEVPFSSTSPSTTTNPSRRSSRNPIQRRPLPMVTTVVKEPERKPAPTASKPTGRPRGRPPKNASAIPIIAPQNAVPAPSRKRGRPPSNPQGGPPRKRGRPPSAATLARRAEEEEQRRRQRAESVTTDDMDVESVGILPSVAVTVSRSGRTVKRSSFHDEIEQGAQFLKSGRNRTSPKSGPTPSECPVGLDDPEQLLGDPAPSPAFASLPEDTKPPAVSSVKTTSGTNQASDRVPPRRKPGARECMQMSRRFGAEVISDKYMDILTDYCSRGKVEHLIRMRERLDEHSRFLESQLAGLEALVKEKGESDVVVPVAPQRPE